MADAHHKVEQGRAETALHHVQAAVNAGDNVADKYKSYVKNLPMLIQINGLGTALTFAKAKGTGGSDEARAYALIYKQIDEWLSDESNAYVFANSDSSGDLVERLVTLESKAHRAATRETLLLLHWLRRLADGMITS